MAIITGSTIPATASYDNALTGGAIRDLIINYNALFRQQAALALAFTSDGVLKGTTLSKGTTNTISLTQCVITIAGVPVSVAAAANTSLTASSALPAGLWTCFGIDAVANGTISFVYSTNIGTGSTSEALAITDALTNVTKTSNKARVGYVTVQAAAANTWTAGTDGLAGGSGGNPAQTTNYYPIASPWQLTADTANAITLGSIALTAKQIGSMSSSNTPITV